MGELRIMSDALAGYTATTYPDRLFGNSLSIATGEHGNDKFMLTIDGEEVEVDLDGDFASSTGQRLSTLVTAEEKLTVDVSAAASLNASTEAKQKKQKKNKTRIKRRSKIDKKKKEQTKP